MIKQGQLPPGPVPFLFPWLCLCLRSFRSNPASRSISRCDMNFASSQKVSLWPFLLLLPLKLQPPERIANTESLLHNLWHLQVIWQMKLVKSMCAAYMQMFNASDARSQGWLPSTGNPSCIFFHRFGSFLANACKSFTATPSSVWITPVTSLWITVEKEVI